MRHLSGCDGQDSGRLRVDPRVERYLSKVLEEECGKVAFCFARSSTTSIRFDGSTTYLDAYPVPESPPYFKPGEDSLLTLMYEEIRVGTAKEKGFGLVEVNGQRVLIRPLTVGSLESKLSEWAMEIITHMINELSSNEAVIEVNEIPQQALSDHE